MLMVDREKYLKFRFLSFNKWLAKVGFLFLRVETNLDNASVIKIPRFDNGVQIWILVKDVKSFF